MGSKPDVLLKYPEWYTVERNTEKIIENLETIKELDFYLNNPDEFIRRLATIRLAKLKLRDTDTALKNILDNTLESNANKELAAWAVKASSLKWNKDVFLTSDLLNKFIGTEKYNEIFKITFAKNENLKYNNDSSELLSDLPSESDEVFAMQSLDFEAGFSTKDWLQTLGTDFTSKAAAFFTGLIPVIALLPYKLIKAVVNLPSSITRKAKRSRQFMKADYTGYNSYHMMYHEPGFGTRLKRAANNLLNTVLSPIRFLGRHKIALLMTVVAMFILINTTPLGKQLAIRYIGSEFWKTQNNIIVIVKEKSLETWDGFKKMSENGLTALKQQIFDSSDKSSGYSPVDSSDSKESLRSIYIITARKGLNLRKHPDAKSVKVSTMPIKYGSSVTYLNKSVTDNNGKLWYYIMTRNGLTGWAAAHFLQKIQK